MHGELFARIARFLMLITTAALSFAVQSTSAQQFTELRPLSTVSLEQLTSQRESHPSRSTAVRTMAWDLPLVSDERVTPSPLPVASHQQFQLTVQEPASSISQPQAQSQLLPLSQNELQTLANLDESHLLQEFSGLHSADERIALDDADEEKRPTSVWRRIWRDEVNFYSPESLTLIGGGLAVGAIIANTRLDHDIQAHIQTSLHQANSDDWLESFHANKELGDGRFTIPIFAGAWAMGSLLPESKFGDTTRMWGERSLRGFLVGAPPLLLLQATTGGSRPNETAHGSEWEPFQDNNGISGHSFMGALPFITAAKMTESRPMKVLFYSASALAPLSRTADGAHYPSQVALGWWMAFVAASAVHATDQPASRIRFYPTTMANGSGMAMEYRF